MPIIFEIVLDIMFNWQSVINDRTERLIMVALVVLPGSMVLLFLDSLNISFIFSCTYAIQYVGCLGPILSICNNLVPEFFTGPRVILVQFFLDQK